jgi:alpha-tubulin suppressor-like RCC1 family protein
VTTTDEGYCWGVAGGTTAPRSNLSLCGITGNTCDGAPALVRGGVAWRSLSAGGSHICGVTTDGTGRCWGWAWWGYAADSATNACGENDPCFPPLVSGGLTFRSISAGDTWHTCGVTDAGAAYCWGYNYTGELGDGKPTDWGLHASTEKNTSGPDNCADEDWGLWIACSVRPSAVVGGIAFTQVQAGELAACGLAASGDAYCWGSNPSGELGNGSTSSSFSYPFPVAGSHRYSMITNTRAGFACGLAADGHAFCWGRNDHGELGILPVPMSPRPVAVSGDIVFDSISAGGTSHWGGHTCGVTPTGSLYCWGSNQFGELGSGTNVSSSSPVKVRGSL